MFLLTLATSLAFANPVGDLEASDTNSVGLDDAAPVAPAAIPELVPPVPPVPRFEADDSVVIRGQSNDVFGAGDQVRLEHRVGDNAFLAGSLVMVAAPVDGDLFVAGQSLRIDAPVGGDVYAAGDRVTIGPEGSVGGHLLAAGANVRVEGPVAGTVNVGAGSLVIAAPIGGDVNAEVGEFRFEEGGSIAGNLEYTSAEALSDAESHVLGTVDWSQTAQDNTNKPSLVEGLLWSLLWNSWRFVSMLIVGASLVLLAGKTARGTASKLIDKPSQSLGLGLAGLAVLPVVSILLVALLIPLPLGLLGLTVFGVLLYVAQLIAALALGELLLRRFRPASSGNALIALAVGLLPVVFFTALPWVGWLVWFVATALGIGAAWLWSRELATTA